jgi:hypothetical protein
MFERYTEKARRAVFFARFEASKFGSPYIETEHLLLGLLREDHSFRDGLPASVERIRKRIEELVPRSIERRETSVDLPLSNVSKRALACAAEESTALQHSSIDCCHLVLGMLRIEKSTAAVLLGELGIAYASYREVVARLQIPPPGPKVSVAPLIGTTLDLRRTLSLLGLIQENGPPLERTEWTRKEALGHLIDWAAAHQQWFARALTGPELTAGGYPEGSPLNTSTICPGGTWWFYVTCSTASSFMWWPTFPRRS